MDIKCAKCSEPWDAYGVRHGDMESGESQRFLLGEGCPTCNFGTTCPRCAGTGKEREDHSPCYCRGEHFIIARILKDSDDGRGECYPYRCDLFLQVGKPVPRSNPVRFGYLPNVQHLTPEQRRRALVLKIYSQKQCRDGWYSEAKLACPLCSEQPTIPCAICAGTGKFASPLDPERTAVFAAAQMLAGDVDGQQTFLEDHT